MNLYIKIYINLVKTSVIIHYTNVLLVIIKMKNFLLYINYE